MTDHYYMGQPYEAYLRGQKSALRFQILSWESFVLIVGITRNGPWGLPGERGWALFLDPEYESKENVSWFCSSPWRHSIMFDRFNWQVEGEWELNLLAYPFSPLGLKGAAKSYVVWCPEALTSLIPILFPPSCLESQSVELVLGWAGQLLLEDLSSSCYL